MRSKPAPKSAAEQAPPGGRPTLRPVLQTLAPFLVWGTHFSAVQALLWLGCERLDDRLLQVLLVAAGAAAAALLTGLLVHARRRRSGALASCLALAGVVWATLAAPLLAPCMAVH